MYIYIPLNSPKAVSSFSSSAVSGKGCLTFKLVSLRERERGTERERQREGHTERERERERDRERDRERERVSDMI